MFTGSDAVVRELVAWHGSKPDVVVDALLAGGGGGGMAPGCRWLGDLFKTWFLTHTQISCPAF